MKRKFKMFSVQKVVSALLIAITMFMVLPGSTLQVRSDYHAGSEDGCLWLYESMLESGEITEEFVLEEIEQNALSQPVVAQLLDDGYLRQYENRLKAGGWLAQDYSLPGSASSASTGADASTGANVSTSETTTSPKKEYTQEEIDNAWGENKRVEPTCVEEGYIEYKNSLTGEKKKETIPVVEHVYTQEETPATCTEQGLITYTCEVCGDTYTEEIPMLEHSYEETDKTEPTCTEDGKQVFTCSVCGDSYEEVLPATGHDAGEWVVVKEAGAFSEGTKELQCTKDGAVLETEMIPQTFPVSLGVVIGICVGVIVIVAGIVIIVVRKKKC